MAYTPTNWVDGSTGGTPITAAALNNIETGVSSNDTAVGTKYTKPSGGIPKTDLDTTTQASLGKADTALQTVDKAAVGLGNVDDTADVDKPVSTAQQAAINGREPAITAGSSAQFRRGDKTWQTLNAAAIIDASPVGQALMTAADVDAVRAVSRIYELGATDDPSTLGIPAESWLFRRPVPTTTEPTRDGFNYQNGVPASGQIVTATADSTLVEGSWMVAVYTGNGSMGTVVAPSGWSALMPRTTVGTLDMCVYAKIADSTDASSKSFAFSSGANAANSSLMLLWGSGSDVVANWIVGTVENRATAGGGTQNIAPSLTTTTDKSLVLVLSGERTAAVDSTAPTVTGATAWVNGPESQTLQLQTTEIAYIDQTTAGATGNVTITYPNTHATNGLALQIAIPAA